MFLLLGARGCRCRPRHHACSLCSRISSRLFRVVVLDDGKEKPVKNLILEYPNLYYHARIKVTGVQHHFKAGNPTGGTDFVTKLDGGEGEFIAALNADMIPEPEWLRAIIAHLVIEPEMA